MPLRRSVLGVVLAALAFGSMGCSNMGGSHVNQVRQWATGAGILGLQSQIRDDLSYISAAQRSGDLRKLRTDCDGFSADVEQAYATLPTPDTALTGDLNDAYEAYFKAAQSCSQLSAFSSPLYRKFQKELAQGNRAFVAASDRLSTISAK